MRTNHCKNVIQYNYDTSSSGIILLFVLFPKNSQLTTQIILVKSNLPFQIRKNQFHNKVDKKCDSQFVSRSQKQSKNDRVTTE